MDPYRVPICPYTLPFRIQKPFSYLSFEPPTTMVIRMSSLIGMDDDSLIFHFSESLSSNQLKFPSIKPEIEGSWIIQDDTLIFRPIDIWRQSTLYLVSIPKDLQSIYDNQLGKKVIVKFETASPIPVIKSPTCESKINFKQVFLIRYGHPVDIPSVINKSYFKIQSRLRSKLIPAREATEEEYKQYGQPILPDDKRIREKGIEILLTPSLLLPSHKNISLIIGKGVISMNQQEIRSKEEYEFTFRTERNFAIRSIFVPNPFLISQSNCIIRFNKNPSNLRNKDLPILMWDHPNFKVNIKSLYNNVITFSIDEIRSKLMNKEAEVKIDCSNLLSLCDESLGDKDAFFTVKVKPDSFPSGFRPFYDQIFILRKPFASIYDTSYSLRIFNYTEVRVCVYQLIDENHILSWLKLPHNSSLPYDQLEYKSLKPIHNTIYSIDNFEKDKEVIFTFEMMNNIFTQGDLIKGIYGIIITPTKRAHYPNTTDYPIVRALIQFSDITLTIVNDRNRLRVWACSLQSLSPLSDVPVNLYYTNPYVDEKIKSINTDKDGLCKMKIPNIMNNLTYALIANMNNDRSLLYFHKPTLKIKRAIAYWFISSDRDLYFSKEKITLFGFVKRRFIDKEKNTEELKSLKDGAEIRISSQNIGSYTHASKTHPNIIINSSTGFFTFNITPKGKDYSHIKITLQLFCNNKCEGTLRHYIHILPDNNDNNDNIDNVDNYHLEVMKEGPLIYAKSQNEISNEGEDKSNFNQIILRGKVTKEKGISLHNGKAKWNIIMRYKDPLLLLQENEEKIIENKLIYYRFGVEESIRSIGEIVAEEEMVSDIVQGITSISLQIEEGIKYAFPIELECSFKLEDGIEGKIESKKEKYSMYPSPHLIGISSSSYPHYHVLQSIPIEIILMDVTSNQLLEGEITLKVTYKIINDYNDNQNDNIFDEKVFDIQTNNTKEVTLNIGLPSCELNGHLIIEVIGISDYNGYRSFTELCLTPPSSPSSSLSSSSSPLLSSSFAIPNDNNIIIEENGAQLSSLTSSLSRSTLGIKEAEVEVELEKKEEKEEEVGIKIEVVGEDRVEIDSDVHFTFDIKKEKEEVEEKKMITLHHGVAFIIRNGITSFHSLSSNENYIFHVPNHFTPNFLIRSFFLSSINNNNDNDNNNNNIINDKNNSEMDSNKVSLLRGSKEVIVKGESKRLKVIIDIEKESVEPMGSCDVTINVMNHLNEVSSNSFVLFIVVNSDYLLPSTLSNIENTFFNSFYPNIPLKYQSNRLSISSNIDLLDDINILERMEKDKINYSEYYIKPSPHLEISTYNDNRFFYFKKSTKLGLLINRAFEELEDLHQGAIVLFSVVDELSLTYARIKITQLKNKANGAHYPILLVANKIDYSTRVISFESGKNAADELGVEYMEVSVSTNTKVHIAVLKLFEMIGILSKRNNVALVLGDRFVGKRAFCTLFELSNYNPYAVCFYFFLLLK